MVWPTKAGAIAFQVLAIFLSLTLSALASPFDVELKSNLISNFKIGQAGRRFQKLEFVGGIEFSSSNAHVGALSGLAVFNDRSGFLAVTDTGFWFTASILRNAEGEPLALDGGRMAAILDGRGKPFEYKWQADAESIALKGDQAFVSFERNDRLLQYRLDLNKFASLPKRIKLNFDLDRIRHNKGLETIAISPMSSALKGAAVVVSERSWAANGGIIGAIVNGPSQGQLAVRRKGKFDITGGDFLPDGDLLLLERRYNLAQGIAMRIRRIDAAKIKPGALLEGKEMIRADSSFQIDNMEGLSVTTGRDGATYVSLISDNNHSLLQRNLFLEFRLIGE